MLNWPERAHAWSHTYTHTNVWFAMTFFCIDYFTDTDRNVHELSKVLQKSNFNPVENEYSLIDDAGELDICCVCGRSLLSLQ